jgi:hypothetical protein
MPGHHEKLVPFGVSPSGRIADGMIKSPEVLVSQALAGAFAASGLIIA